MTISKYAEKSANEVIDNRVAVYFGDLVVEHNHGVYVLENAEWQPLIYISSFGPMAGTTIQTGVLKGTVVDGGVTNRLFGHTNYTPATVGSTMSVTYGEPTGIAKRQDGVFHCNICTCG